MSSCIGKAINMDQQIVKFHMPDWNVFATKKFLKNPRDLGITGKYLFFHTKSEILEKLAEDEIKNNGFDVAKISDRLGKHKNFVLCLYSQDDSRKDELAQKYQGKDGISYRYWKSDEDTAKGKYSKQYLDELKKE